MTPRTWTRMLGTAALALLLAPGGTLGQDPESRAPEERPLGPGMVLDEDGGWRVPTMADALGALRGDPDVALPVGVQRFDPALAVLRQEYESRPAEELDRLANALADLILASDDPEDMTEEYYLESDAFRVLRWSASRGGRGTPHPGSFDALVRVYETIAAEALAGGGTDPVAELARRGPGGYSRLSWALRSIFSADRAGRGADYLLAVVAESEPPKLDDWPAFPYSLWCTAASILRGNGLSAAENPRRAELPDAALDDEMFYQLCNLH